MPIRYYWLKFLPFEQFSEYPVFIKSARAHTNINAASAPYQPDIGFGSVHEFLKFSFIRAIIRTEREASKGRWEMERS
jgi:hypothetical protein